MFEQSIPPEKYESMLADIRDLFPVPAEGSELEQPWASAMTAAEYVPAYVKACVEKLQRDNLALTSAALSATTHIIKDIAKKFDVAGTCTPVTCLECRV